MTEVLQTVRNEAQVMENVYALLQIAVEKGVETTGLEKLMEMREKILKEKAISEFNRAFAEAQAEIPPIPKDKVVYNKDGSVRYRYASLDTILDTVRPILTRHGFSILFKTACNDKSVTVTCILRHIGGHEEETSFTAPIDPSSNMTEIQKYGAALSYAKRYALSSLLGITADEDTDANIETEISDVTVTETKTTQENGNGKDNMATEKQIAKIQVLLKDMPRERRLALVSEIIGRPITSAKDLTRKEASTIIDALTNPVSVEEVETEVEPF